MPALTSRHALLVLSLVAAGLATTSWLAARRGPAPESAHLGAPEEVRAAGVWATTLPDLAERPQPLKQWLGKVVVLNFWAPWCPPCRKEIPGFIELQARLGGKGLQFVGIALDEADKVQAYVDETGINYPILLGGLQAVTLGQDAGNRLGGLPYTVVFDRQGNAVATLTGAVAEERLAGIVAPLL
ncbi:MAG: TlpA disulfide reductase family protein [Pseudomonadota bacterium]